MKGSVRMNTCEKCNEEFSNGSTLELHKVIHQTPAIRNYFALLGYVMKAKQPRR
jgi:hypothetical protein